MTQIKISRVVSVSSEDPKHPASNLLKPEISGCWKCKEAGEKQAVIILQLEKPCFIENVTIGNENSAFIELLVGKSAVPDTYEVLKVTSSLMSVQESRSEKNKHAVKFFKREEFTKSVTEQSWDRIKIVCSQPFNKNSQYGLSFIKVYSKSSDDERSNDNSTLGRFVLKKDKIDDSQLPIGSFFAKRKEASETDIISAAAAIRAANNNPSSAIKPKRLSDVLLDFKDSKKKRINEDADLDISIDCRRTTTGRLLYAGNLSDEEAADESSTKKTSQSDSNSRNGTPKIDRKKQILDVDSSHKKSPKTPKSKINNIGKISDEDKKVFKRKPFNRLLEDVVFVLSGFQNPLRANLRSKAIKMGAKYKADWDSSCTHLVCAFTNTPKLNKVKGKGWIVRKNWIEDCYQMRKRLLCSSYILDNNDTFTKPEEEIWEETSESKTVMSESSHEVKKPKLHQAEGTERSQSTISSQGSSSISQDDVYDVDTDVDSDCSYSNSVPDTSNYEHYTFQILPDFFENKKFYLGTDLVTSIVDMLKRYIIAYKGDVLDDIDNVNYIISGDSRYKENVSNIPVILPDWIWECNDKKTLIPADHYALK